MPKQLAFELHPIHYDIITDPTRFKVIIAGRRFYKTGMFLAATAQHLTEPCFNIRTNEKLYHNIGYYAPTFTQAKAVYWERAKDALDPLIQKVNESELSIVFKNKGKLRLWGTDQAADKLRGGYDSLQLHDEFAYHKSGIYETVLRPKLSDTQGRALFATSPNGFNHAYGYYKRGLTGSDFPEYKSWQYPSVAGGYITESEVQAAKKDMTLTKWRQEYLAEFVGMEGRVVLDWSYVNVDTNVKYDPGKRIYVSCDFNVNPMCWAILHYDNDDYLYFDEIAMPHTNVRKAAEELGKRYHQHGADIILTGDASGKSRNYLQTELSETAYPQMVEVLKTFGLTRVGVDVRRGNPKIQDRIDAFNHCVSDGNGTSRVRVNPLTCPKILYAMENWRYIENSSVIYNPTDSDINTNPDQLYVPHMGDAVTYVVERYSALPRKISSLADKNKMIAVANRGT